MNAPNQSPPWAPLAGGSGPLRRARYRALAPLLTALVAPALGGCVTPVEHDGVEVKILEGHRHSAYCGHYFHRFAWYFVKDHHHGDSCGHVLRYGQWTIE